MIFQVHIEAGDDGEVTATCPDPAVTVLAMNSASALEQLRAEIRYRVELCPCSSVGDDFVQLEVR